MYKTVVQVQKEEFVTASINQGCVKIYSENKIQLKQRAAVLRNQVANKNSSTSFQQ